MDYAAARRLVGEQLTKIQGSVKPLGEWDDILERLRKRGLAQLSIGQQIRVGRLLARLAQDGNNLSDKKAVADYLVSILAFNAQEARLVRSEFGVVDTGIEPPRHETDLPKRRWPLFILFPAILAVVAGLAFYSRQFWVDPAPDQPVNPVEPAAPLQWSDLFARIAGTLPSDLTAQWSHIATGLVMTVPILLASVLLLVLRHHRRETILRGHGQSGAARELKVPPARALLDESATQRIMHALQDWQHLRSVESIEIDVTETIRYAARNFGRPEWHYRTRRSRPLYVLLVDRGVAGDHMGLIAHTIEERLKAAGLVFERYDFTEDPRRLWNAGSLARLTPPESLSTVVARHRGERLILLSDGEAFGGPVWAEFADLIALFSRAVLIDPTPEYRWGERQEAMAEAGLLVVPLSPEGFVRGISAFGEGAEDARAEVASGIGEEIDPFLIQLRRERGRYLADIPLEEDQTRRLIRQIRNYLSRDELYELFVAIAAFPKIAPSVTLYLAEALRGRPIDLRQAGQLARLPWLRVGRMPDWLRIALLESLPQASAERLRSIFTAMLSGVPNATKQTLPDPREVHRAAKITVVAKPNFLDALRGTEHSGAFGEHIFIGFMKREPLSIDAPDAAGRPWWRRFDWLDYLTIAAVPLVAMAIIVFEQQLIDLRERLIGGNLLLRIQLYLAIFTVALLSLRLLLQSGVRWLDVPVAKFASGSGLIVALASIAIWSSLVATQNAGLALIGLLLCGYGSAVVLVEPPVAEAAPAGRESRSEVLTMRDWFREDFPVVAYGFYSLWVALSILEVGVRSPVLSGVLIIAVLTWPIVIWSINAFIFIFFQRLARRQGDRRADRASPDFPYLFGIMWGAWMALAALLVGSWETLEMKANHGAELHKIILFSFLLYFYLERRFRLASTISTTRAEPLKFETQMFYALAIDILISYISDKLSLPFDTELILAPIIFLVFSRITVVAANPSLSNVRRMLLFAGYGNGNAKTILILFAIVLSWTGVFLQWNEAAMALFTRLHEPLSSRLSTFSRIQFELMSLALPAFNFGAARAACSLIERFAGNGSPLDQLYEKAKAIKGLIGLLKWVAQWALVAGVIVICIVYWGINLAWMLPPLAVASWWLGRLARFAFIATSLFALAALSVLAFADPLRTPRMLLIDGKVDYAGGVWCIAALYFWMRYIDDGEFRRRALTRSHVSWLELALITISVAPAMLLTFARGTVSVNPGPMLLSVLVIAGVSSMPLLRPLGLIAVLLAIWIGTTAAGVRSSAPIEIAWGISPGQVFAALLALLTPRVAQFIQLQQQSDPSWRDSPKNLPLAVAFTTLAMCFVGVCASLDILPWRPGAVSFAVSALPLEVGLLLAFFAGFVVGQMQISTLMFAAIGPPASAGLLALTPLPSMIVDLRSDAQGIITNIIACLAWYALGITVRRLTTYGNLRFRGTAGGSTGIATATSTSEVSS